MTKALLVRPDNTTERVDIGGLDDIYKYLECNMFEVVHNGFDKPYDMYCDEEFGLYNLDDQPHLNELGTLYHGHQPILGNVLVVGKPDADGETTDLDELFFQEVEWIVTGKVKETS